MLTLEQQIWNYLTSFGSAEIEIDSLPAFLSDAKLNAPKTTVETTFYRLRNKGNLETITTTVGNRKRVIGIKLLKGPSVGTVIRNQKMDEPKIQKIAEKAPTPLLGEYLAKKNLYEKIKAQLTESGFLNDIAVQFEEDPKMEETLYLFNLVNSSIAALNEVLEQKRIALHEASVQKQLVERYEERFKLNGDGN